MKKPYTCSFALLRQIIKKKIDKGSCVRSCFWSLSSHFTPHQLDRPDATAPELDFPAVTVRDDLMAAHRFL